MTRLRPLALLLLALPACATLTGGGGSRGARAGLWEEAHAAYAADSFRVAAAAFQRLAAEHGGSPEGHEARFHLAMLALEPGSGVDLATARTNLSLYLAEDSTARRRGAYRYAAGTLLALIDELQKPCGQRVEGLPCPVETRVVTRPGDPAPTGDASAELARLRREIAERDGRIRELQEELQRIRNTLAPRRP